MPQPRPVALPDTLAPPDTTDSLRAAVDSLRTTADSLGAVVDSVKDSTSVLTKAAKDVGDASELLVRGRFDQFVEHLVRSLQRMLADFLPMLVKALVVFGLCYGLYRLVRMAVRGVVERSETMDEGLRGLILRSLRIVAFLVITAFVLAQFGIDLTVLFGGLSILGLALGFAAKDTLENFLSGVVIMLDRPFRVGDQVNVDGTYGTVVDISLRSTRLRTLNNEIMVMPNLQMVNQKLVNHAMLGAVRVAVPFGIAYHEHPEDARRVLLPLAETDERIAQDPPPRVVVTELGDSAVSMELRFFLPDPSLEVPIRFEYLERVHAALRDASVDIPFPQLDVRIVPHEQDVPAPPAPPPTAAFDAGETAVPLVDVKGARPRDEVGQIAERLEEQGVDPADGLPRPRRPRPDGA